VDLVIGILMLAVFVGCALDAARDKRKK